MADRQSTHGPDCWSWGPAHYECAVREIERLRKDAARYRWLRDQIKSGPLVVAKCGSWDLKSWSGDDPDTRIDEAMEEEIKT